MFIKLRDIDVGRTYDLNETDDDLEQESKSGLCAK